MTISIKQLWVRKGNNRRLTVNFFGTPVTVDVTSTPSVVRRWLEYTIFKYRRFAIGRHIVVGLGVHWVPEPYRGDQQPAATLQLCVGRRCLIVQLNYAPSVPAKLRRVLRSPRFRLVGLWNHSDKKKLRTTRHNLEVGELYDMRLFVNSRITGEPLRRASREQIIEEYLGFSGVSFDSEISRSNWADRQLNKAQIMQACVDAYASFLIGKKARI